MADDNPQIKQHGSPASRAVYRGLWIACALMAVADLFYLKHITFRIEEFPVFYGIFAFVVGIGLVLAGREIGNFVERDEDYYDR